jgi:hypothetical protein
MQAERQTGPKCAGILVSDSPPEVSIRQSVQLKSLTSRAVEGVAAARTPLLSRGTHPGCSSIASTACA